MKNIFICRTLERANKHLKSVRHGLSQLIARRVSHGVARTTTSSSIRAIHSKLSHVLQPLGDFGDFGEKQTIIPPPTYPLLRKVPPCDLSSSLKHIAITLHSGLSLACPRPGHLHILSIFHDIQNQQSTFPLLRLPVLHIALDEFDTKPRLQELEYPPWLLSRV